MQVLFVVSVCEYVCVCFCCSFTPKQHLRSYQNGYQLVPVCTHDSFIVLPHWELRPPVP